jgi:nitrogen-specific signal transduction histidine kinase
LSHNIAQLRMQNKDAEQRKFVSNFSHELRTPINGILGSAQFLQDTISDDYQNELLQSIVVSSNTLLDTVSNLLFISLKPILPTHVTWFWLGSRTRCFAVKKTTNSISSLTSF